jgi:methoxymalonate biosynthesis acyl carrier protein
VNASIDPIATDPVTVRLRGFLESRTRARWEPDVDLFAAGAVSSLFALELVVYLEKTFDVAVGADELLLANFRSVRSMTALVHRLRAAAGE